MGTVLKMPGAVRAELLSRELNRFATEVLRYAKRHGGDRAFDQVARDLIVSVCAILARERGHDAVAALFDHAVNELFDLIEIPDLPPDPP
jgi:hypothetical protein